MSMEGGGITIRNIQLFIYVYRNLGTGTGTGANIKGTLLYVNDIKA